MCSGLIAANVVVFLMLALSPSLEEVLGLPPDVRGVAGQPWSLVTVAFTSANVLHLLVAVAVLVVFGMEVEHLIGPGHLLAVYLLAGIGGAVATLAVAGPTEFSDTSLGASAAFLGVLGAAAVIPRSPLLRQLQVEKVVAVVAVIAVVGPLAGVGEWVSSAAHAAGMAAGALYSSRRRTDVRGVTSDSAPPRQPRSKIP